MSIMLIFYKETHVHFSIQPNRYTKTVMSLLSFNVLGDSSEMRELKCFFGMGLAVETMAILNLSQVKGRTLHQFKKQLNRGRGAHTEMLEYRQAGKWTNSFCSSCDSVL